MISLERINVKDHIFSRQGELILSLDLCNMPQFILLHNYTSLSLFGKKKWSEILLTAFSEILKLKSFLFNFQSLPNKGRRVEEHTTRRF